MQRPENNKTVHDGLVWALFICFVAVTGFVTVLYIQNSEIVSNTSQIPHTAGVRNAIVEDVEVVIVPLNE